MQNEHTLINLGFERHPAWDWDSGSPTPHFRKQVDSCTYRAYVVTCNGPVYVQMGKVTSPDGKVSSWKDCCSEGSVARKIGLASRYHLNKQIAI